MPTRFENQTWYAEWREVVERVVAARMARDSTRPDAPEGEKADKLRVAIGTSSVQKKPI